jgi:putative membrane protein
MRWVQGLLLLGFLSAVGAFALQNREPVAVDFFAWSLSAPLAILIVSVYFLGMLSGWTVVSFVRRSLQRVSEAPRR